MVSDSVEGSADQATDMAVFQANSLSRETSDLRGARRVHTSSGRGRTKRRFYMGGFAVNVSRSRRFRRVADHCHTRVPVGAMKAERRRTGLKISEFGIKQKKSKCSDALLAGLLVTGFACACALPFFSPPEVRTEVLEEFGQFIGAVAIAAYVVWQHKRDSRGRHPC